MFGAGRGRKGPAWSLLCQDIVFPVRCVPVWWGQGWCRGSVSALLDFGFWFLVLVLSACVPARLSVAKQPLGNGAGKLLGSPACPNPTVQVW